MKEKTIPKTKLRREIRKWIRYLDKNPMHELTITVNNLPKYKVISILFYEMITIARKDLTDEDKSWLNAESVGEEKNGCDDP